MKNIPAGVLEEVSSCYVPYTRSCCVRTPQDVDEQPQSTCAVMYVKDAHNCLTAEMLLSRALIKGILEHHVVLGGPPGQRARCPIPGSPNLRPDIPLNIPFCRDSLISCYESADESQ
jgi:hypothetical protein